MRIWGNAVEKYSQRNTGSEVVNGFDLLLLILDADFYFKNESLEIRLKTRILAGRIGDIKNNNIHF